MIEAHTTPGLLVALPNLQDPYFQKAVVLLCDYTEDRAFGIVINRPSAIYLRDLFEQDFSGSPVSETPILAGGPVQQDFFWALHTPEFEGQSTRKIGSRLAMSSIQDLLSAISEGKTPKHHHLGCGYAGWGPGQLDQELRQGAWWIAPLTEELVLERPYQDRWGAALESIGINPLVTFHTTGEA